MSLDNVNFDFSKPAKVFRALPSGRYLAHIIEDKETVSQGGTPGLQVLFGVDSALDNQDLTDIDLARVKVFDTHWITEKSIGVVQDNFFRKVFPEYEGKSLDLATARNEMINRPVVINIRTLLKDKNGATLKYPRYEVQTYEAVS
jgi:hypothetical protein